MKRFILVVLISLSFANYTFAQENNNLNYAQKKAIIDAVIKSDNDALKAPTKPNIWLERAIAYLDLASFPDSTVALKDSEAPFKALDFISEVIKLDTKDGVKGPYAKEAENLIVGNIKSKAYGAFMNLAVIKYNNQDYLNSNKYIKKAYDIAPNDSTTTYWKGAIALWCKEYNEAKEAFESYLRIGGLDINVMHSLSQLYLLENQEFKSNEIKSKAIAIYGLANWSKQENSSNEESKGAETAIVEKVDNTPTETKEVVSKVDVKVDNVPKNDELNLTYNVRVETILNNQIEINNFKNEKTKSHIPFKLKNGFYNILNPTNSKIDNSSYDEIIPSNFNCLKVRKDNLWGLINSKGELLVPVKYQSINNENINYILAINIKDEKSLNWDFNYLDKKLDVYNRNGTRIYNEYVFTNLNNTDTENNFDSKIGTNILTFWGVENYKANSEKNKNDFEEAKNKKNIAGFSIFSKDKIITKFLKPGNKIITSFNEFNNAICVNFENQEVALIDSACNILFKTKYEYGEQYRTLRYVGEDRYTLKDEKYLYALIDKNGSRLTPFKFSYVQKFRNNRALVRLANGYWEFIDKKGETIIKLGNEHNQDDFLFFQNYIPVTSSKLLDTLGNEVKLPNLGPNSEILVHTYYSNHINFSIEWVNANRHLKYGVIGIDGKIIASPKYDKISKFKYGYAIIKNNGKYGIINDLGKEIVNLKYDNIYLLVKNESGELIYDRWKEAESGHAESDGDYIVFNDLIKVELNGEEFYIDIFGNEFQEK
jgi:hypothetical protein